jgi:predicted DNA-binding transcriptional regulator AlpA
MATRVNPTTLITDPLVKRKALAEELAQSLTTIWRWTRDGYLPQPVRLGKTVGWPRSVIDDWKIQQGWPAPEQAEVAN